MFGLSGRGRPLCGSRRSNARSCAIPNLVDREVRLWPCQRQSCSRKPALSHQRQWRTLVHSVDPARSSFTFELLGPGWTNRARLTDDMLNSIMELPGTRGMYDLRSRADALSTWKMALQRGTLPRMDDVDWPQDPFKTKFAESLRNLEMPRFTRRYPALLDSLMKQMLGLAQEFEEKLAAAEREQQQRQQQQQQQQQMSSQGGQQQEQQQQNQDSQQASSAGGGGTEQQGGQPPPDQMDINEEELQQMMQEALEQAKNQQGQQGQQQQGRQLQIKMQDMEGDIKDPQNDPNQQALSAQLERIADDIVKQFQAQMGEIMENLAEGEMAFDDLNALLDDSNGFDTSRGVWRHSGWKELSALREVLEKVPELRDLVRQLGRGGGRGPLRRAPEEVEKRGYPPGVIRSPLQPEEVRGLTRSGELSRMLPSEMALLAHGWPRKIRNSADRAASKTAGYKISPAGGAGTKGSAGAPAPAAARAAAPATSTSYGGAGEVQVSGGRLKDWRQRADRELESKAAAAAAAAARRVLDFPSAYPPSEATDSSEEFLEEYYLPGAHAARMLHRVRRAERMLLSYERTGWLDDEPARVTGRMEIRPAAELGPIILCLDTSGSMRGARETVAKALALECLRGAHRQKRACYLYAFSGPQEVMELELRVDVDSLDQLLAFLSCSFQGGTDVDAPLKLSMERLAKAEWSNADILMVTDGEIPNPTQEIIEAISRAHAEMGLEVHGLLVSSHVSDAMRKLCTDLHIFKSWSAVGGSDYMYA